MSMFEPKRYDGPDGVEVGLILDLAETCTIISQHLGKDPKQMTAFEFLSDLKMLEKRFKKNSHG